MARTISLEINSRGTRSSGCTYPLISPGGWVVFDDWKFQQAQEAILAYREKHGITSTMHASGKHKGPPFTTVDQMVFWRKDR